MKKSICLALLILAITASPALAQDAIDKAFEEFDKAADHSLQKQEENWEKLDAALEAQWAAQVKQTEAEWEKLRSQVEQKWDKFYYSTNKEWVDYDEGKDVRSRVNFEEGEIEITVLVPVSQISQAKPEQQKEAAIAQAKEQLTQQVEKVFSANNEVKTEVLVNQVKDAEGKPVSAKNVDNYTEKQLIPQVVVDEKPIVANDGQPRIKVTTKIKMVPEHLAIRADKFKPQVKEYAEKYKLNPALVFAVIHTESYFNPLAKSQIPAYGLMQLVPRYAGIEAYNHLYGEKKLPQPDYLYTPENNIQLGATYLYLLDSKYFAQVKNPANRQSLSIAAYNCGPTRLNKKLVGKYDFDHMDNKEAVELIRLNVPDETKDYVIKVQGRIPLYEGM